LRTEGVGSVNVLKELFATVAVLVGLTTVANADVKIAMRPGSQCWTYHGLDSRYFGDFAADQAITIAVIEEQVNENGGAEVIAYSGERIFVNGPNYFRNGNSEEPNDRIILTEKPGEYIFNLYEHGTGSRFPVFVKICARKKSRK
jgi:hypothetical protein